MNDPDYTEVKKEKRVEVQTTCGPSGLTSSKITFSNYSISELASVLLSLVRVKTKLGKSGEETNKTLDIAIQDIPPEEDMKECIVGKGGFMSHTKRELMEELLGCILNYKNQKNSYNAFSWRLKKARDMIELEYNGNFSRVYRTRKDGIVEKPYWLYEFSKDIGPHKGVTSSSDSSSNQKTDEIDEEKEDEKNDLKGAKKPI